MSQKTQIIICKCGAIRAASHEPFCYEKEWKKRVAEAIVSGHRVEIIGSEFLDRWSWDCSCKTSDI